MLSWVVLVKQIPVLFGQELDLISNETRKGRKGFNQSLQICYCELMNCGRLKIRQF